MTPRQRQPAARKLLTIEKAGPAPSNDFAVGGKQKTPKHQTLTIFY
jgi:hypothetical protein